MKASVVEAALRAVPVVFRGVHGVGVLEPKRGREPPKANSEGLVS